MPFNGSGVFTIVNTFVPNTTILSAAVNANFSDIATGLSDCLTRDGQAGMTAAFKAISGSAGAPSITFTADATTGLYLIGSGDLGISSGGILGLELNPFQVTIAQQAAEAKLFCIIDTGKGSTSTNINTIATSSTGLIQIGTSTNWPTNGYLIAGNEVLSYTVASANGLTINARGQMGTTAVTHATGANINYLYTSVAPQTMLLPARATASRPSNPAPGEFGYNSGSGGLEFYNGSWVSTSQPQLVPQGYLSPTAGTPIITGDATSQATVYYNPYIGNVLPVPTSGIFNLQTFTTAAMTLSASQAVNGIYDVYAFVCSTNSTLTFGFSPSWSAGTSGSVTPGSCLRGTATGGTALTYVNGLPTNAITMTILNGASSYSIATSSGLMLGSVYISPTTAGTVNLHRSYGPTRQWGISNAFNQTKIYLKAGDNTATWTYTTNNVFRPSNNATANNLMIFNTLGQTIQDIEFSQFISGNNANTTAKIGIGYNATATASGMVANTWDSAATSTIGTTVTAKYIAAPALGLNQITSLEQSGNGGSLLYNGTETSMLLSAFWFG